MADVDLIGQFTRRIEVLFLHGNFQLAHEVIDQAEVELTSKPEAVSLDSPLADVGLPSRIVSILEAAGVRTVRDALARTPDELREIPNFGAGSVRLLVSTMRSLPCAGSPLRVVWPDDD